VTDDNATGERLGHVLLAIVRFVCGAAIGAFLFVVIAVRIAHWMKRWDLLSVSLFIAFVVVCGLLAALFGERFFDWVKDHFWDD